MASTVMVVSPDRVAGARLAGSIQAETGLRGAFVPSVADARVLSRSDAVELAMAVIDADLPAGQGQALCADLVKDWHDLPVMMVGQSGSEADVVRSLDAGAIDHFARPHHRAELLARLRAHLRSNAASLAVELRIGNLMFYPGQRALVDRTRQSRLWLTAKEARILRRLHQADGHPVPKEELMRAAWGTPGGADHTLQTHIYRLRCKLGTHASRPMLLTTPRGYQLTV